MINNKKKRYIKFKKKEKVDFELVRQFKESLDDLKEGEVRRVV